MKPEEATKMIYKVDKARTAYHKRYAKYAPGDPDSKQIMIDSSMLGAGERRKFWQRSCKGDSGCRERLCANCFLKSEMNTFDIFI